MNIVVTDATTLYLDRTTGRIAYSLLGDGPLIICLPGMGDVRSVYRFLAKALAEAGFRVASMDLRGHGDSDATFDVYDDVVAGTDLIALAEHLGGPAILIGNSMGAGASVWAAAEAPELTAGLVLIGPFVRNPKTNPLAKLMFRLVLLRPWGPVVWKAYFRTLYPKRRNAEFDAHFAEISEDLRKPGHWDAFHKTTHSSHDLAEARLGEVVHSNACRYGRERPGLHGPKNRSSLDRRPTERRGADSAGRRALPAGRISGGCLTRSAGVRAPNHVAIGDTTRVHGASSLL